MKGFLEIVLLYDPTDSQCADFDKAEPAKMCGFEQLDGALVRRQDRHGLPADLQLRGGGRHVRGAIGVAFTA